MALLATANGGGASAVVWRRGKVGAPLLLLLVWGGGMAPAMARRWEGVVVWRQGMAALQRRFVLVARL